MLGTGGGSNFMERKKGQASSSCSTTAERSTIERRVEEEREGEERERLSTASTLSTSSSSSSSSSKRDEAMGDNVKEEIATPGEEERSTIDISNLEEQINIAQQAQRAWKLEQKRIVVDRKKISLEEKNDLLKEAEEAVAYWTALKEESLKISNDVAEQHEAQIWEFAKASRAAAVEAQTTQKQLQKIIDHYRSSLKNVVELNQAPLSIDD